LAVPLAACAFDLAADPPTLASAPELGDDPTQWQFARRTLAPPHVLAVALRRGGAAPPRRLVVGEATAADLLGAGGGAPSGPPC
jgi:hypothetical protein